ncbi:MAG TPA: response regulator [Flavisolibacter sp.]|nr:response regulator [Flavisolibacter sp.]
MSNATTASKSTILYVDDDSDDCIFLKTSIEDAGNKANVICAADGEEAVNYLNSVFSNELPSLIVLDLNMPRWDGRKTLSYLKSHPHLSSIPVVVLSTSENEKEKQHCTQLGAVSYHRKPHRFEEYKGIVANFFQIIQP